MSKKDLEIIAGRLGQISYHHGYTSKAGNTILFVNVIFAPEKHKDMLGSYTIGLKEACLHIPILEGYNMKNLVEQESKEKTVKETHKKNYDTTKHANISGNAAFKNRETALSADASAGISKQLSETTTNEFTYTFKSVRYITENRWRIREPSMGKETPLLCGIYLSSDDNERPLCSIQSSSKTVENMDHLASYMATLIVHQNNITVDARLNNKKRNPLDILAEILCKKAILKIMIARNAKEIALKNFKNSTSMKLTSMEVVIDQKNILIPTT